MAHIYVLNLEMESHPSISHKEEEEEEGRSVSVLSELFVVRICGRERERHKILSFSQRSNTYVLLTCLNRNGFMLSL